MKKKKSVMLCIGIAVLVIIAMLIIVLVIKKKIKTIEEIRVIENNDVKIELVNVSKMQEYLAIEYSVTAKKGAQYFNSYTDNTNGINYLLNNVVRINGKLVDNTMQMSDKISDTEVKVVELIKLSDITLEKTNTIEMSVYEERHDVDTKRYELDSDKDIDAEVYYEYIVSDDEDEEVADDDELDDEDYSYNIGDEEGLSETVEGEYVVSENHNKGSSDKKENGNGSTGEESSKPESNTSTQNSKKESSTDIGEQAIGNLLFTFETSEVEKDVTTKTIKNEKLDVNKNICINDIQEIITKTGEKIVIVNSELANVSNVDENAINPARFSINVQDEKGNTIDVAKYENVDILLEDGRKWAETGREEVRNGKAQIKTYILVDKDTSKIKIQPVYQKDAGISLDAWNAKVWNKVKDGKYEGTNTLDGKVTITKIEEKSGELLFHYTTSGCISEEESILIIKNINKDEYEPCEIRRKSGNEKIAGYTIDDESVNEEDRFIVVGELEFSIFEGLSFEMLGTGIEVQI